MQVALELLLEDVAVHHPSLCGGVPCSGTDSCGFHCSGTILSVNSHTLRASPALQVAKLLNHPWETWPWVAWSMPPEV